VLASDFSFRFGDLPGLSICLPLTDNYTDFQTTPLFVQECTKFAMLARVNNNLFAYSLVLYLYGTV